MSKKLSGLLILCVSTLWLSGCVYFRATGPCFGVGCPAHTVGQNGQYKPGQAPKAQTAVTSRSAAPNAQVAANATVAANSPAAPASQPAPAQAKASEAKASVATKVGDFFTRLIPHHNKPAKSTAATD